MRYHDKMLVVDSESEDLGQALTGVRFAFMSGRETFSLDEARRYEMRGSMQEGLVLDFARSIKSLL